MQRIVQRAVCNLAFLLVASGCIVIRCYMVHGNDASQATSAAAPTVSDKLIVEPVEIVLHGSSRQQQIIVTLNSGCAEPLDVTRQCEISIADQSFASVSGTTLVAVGNGATHVIVKYKQLEVRVPLRVENCELNPPIHFASDVVPTGSPGGQTGSPGGQTLFTVCTPRHSLGNREQGLPPTDPRATHTSSICANRGHG